MLKEAEAAKKLDEKTEPNWSQKTTTKKQRLLGNNQQSQQAKDSSSWSQTSDKAKSKDCFKQARTKLDKKERDGQGKHAPNDKIRREEKPPDTTKTPDGHPTPQSQSQEAAGKKRANSIKDRSSKPTEQRNEPGIAQDQNSLDPPDQETGIVEP